MGVNLLPFIDRKRLVSAIRKVEKGLNKSEVERNSFGCNVIFVEKQE